METIETIETLIPDNEGNHLVVVLYFYDDEDKEDSFIHFVTSHLNEKYND